MDEPSADGNSLLVEGTAVGVCGTDRDIVAGHHGAPPPGRDRLILGHESLGRVVLAPSGSKFSSGDLVVGMVRRPDPVPCGSCQAGEPDMCRNGRYTERGIKRLDGYASQRWVVEPEYAIALDPALANVGMLLAALLGVQRGLDVHVLDLATGGPKPDLVRDLGATYHHQGIDRLSRLDSDIVIEATGAAGLVLPAMTMTSPYGIVCLTGVTSLGRWLTADPGAINQEIVLENDVVVGSVSANQRHFHQAARALAAADLGWLRGLITRRVPLAEASDALAKRDDDIKTVIELRPAS